jgi:hypothetical protein
LCLIILHNGVDDKLALFVCAHVIQVQLLEVE